MQPRKNRLRVLRAAIAAVALMCLPWGHPAPSLLRADDSPSGSGVQVTLSATLEQGDPISRFAIRVQMTLDNQTGRDLSGLSLQSALPAGAGVGVSWIGQRGQQPGSVQGQTIRWDGLTVASGQQLGPVSFSLLPFAGYKGAEIFLDAAITPQVAWTGPSAQQAMTPSLPLSGLWGEDGLRRTVLPSGLTIFTQERPDTPTVAIRIAARAGSRDEDDSTCGGSHWLEHAHLLGTITRPDNQAIGRAISTVGGQFNAATGWEATNFWILVPADKFGISVDILSDEIVNSTFPPDAFEREKQVILQEIKLRTDTVSTRAFDDFMDVIFQSSPLHRSPAATICLLTLPVSTILAYRAQHYVTGNMVIAASGNLKHDVAVASIAKAFAGIPAGQWYSRPVAPEPIETQPRKTVDGTGTGLAELRLGWPVAGTNDPDWAPTLILSDILGGVGRRLAQTLRDNHTVGTGVSASYLDFSDAGALMLSASTSIDGVDLTTRLFTHEIQRLRDGDVSQADVDAALKSTTGQRALEGELNLAQTDRATDAATGVLQSYDEVLARLDSVQPADVQRVALKYLDPVNYALVIVQQ